MAREYSGKPGSRETPSSAIIPLAIEGIFVDPVEAAAVQKITARIDSLDLSDNLVAVELSAQSHLVRLRLIEGEHGAPFGIVSFAERERPLLWVQLQSEILSRTTIHKLDSPEIAVFKENSPPPDTIRHQ